MDLRQPLAGDRGTAAPSSPNPAGHRLPLGSLLFLSAWCGLVAGLLEVAAFVVYKRFFDSNHLYQTSRHFVWLLPTTDLCIFLILGVFGDLVSLVLRRRGPWLISRLLCALTLLPIFLVAFPQIYGLALFLVALGIAAQLVPMVERRAAPFRRIVRTSLPALVTALLILAAWPWAADRLAQRREQSRPLPPPGSPNVLLIVMDTVAAGHLGLYGHDRATSTSLADLADQGISFSAVQSASSWTLPSHAAMFTGRWMHELTVGWHTPLDTARPTLAEYLGARGYATAGVVANMAYCARDSGLARGFTTYRDFIFPKLTAFRKAALVRRPLEGLGAVAKFVEDDLAVARVRPYAHMLTRWFDKDRKPAAVVNRELFDWLAFRAQPERPFFAFLNYFDAHYPYQLPAGRFHRFGGSPADVRQLAIIEEWGVLEKNQVTPEEVAFAARAYDDCIADLDEQIGRLTDRLRRDGVLDQTWLIVVADHGESFGEHPNVFCHGVSLYQTEVHVPLVIVPPGGAAKKRVIAEAVSLRDLAATIVELTGQTTGSPFPGTSLARYFDDSIPASRLQAGDPDPTLAEVVTDPDVNKPDRKPGSTPTTPLGALKNAEWSYIRREVDRHEELFHLREDQNEKHNLAALPAMRSTLDRMRATLDRKTAGPLFPGRFSP